MASQRAVLEKNLSTLLGFEDGSSAVLDYLLEIESTKELLDYLSQLLGSHGDGVVRFVEQVDRFQRGEPVETTSAAATLNNVEESPSSKSRLDESSPKAKTVSTKLPNTTPTKGGLKAKSASEQVVRHTDSMQSGLQPPKQVEKTTTTLSRAKPSDPPVPLESTSVQSSTKQSPLKESLPTRGKAPINCGCFGRLHPALTNCLYCGRIACEKEGYNFCPFCGYRVEQVHQDPKSHDKAWLHKERLLRYDREHAQRLVILDDHADYFRDESPWMDDEQNNQAAAMDEERLRSRREKMQLNLSL